MTDLNSNNYYSETQSLDCINTPINNHQARFDWENLIATIALRIRQSLDLRKILQTTTDEVQQLLSCDRVLLYQFAPDWSGQVVVESIASPQWSLLDQVVHDNCFEASWLESYHEGRYVAIDDIANSNLSTCHVNFLSQYQIKSNLVIPVLNESQIWGLLIAHNCTELRAWQSSEIDGLLQIAVHVGIAIHQASLLEQLQATKASLQEQVAARTTELEQANQELSSRVYAYNLLASSLVDRQSFTRQVLDTLFSFVGVLAPDGTLLEINRDPLEIAGIARQDVIGKAFADAYWWAYLPEVPVKIREAIAQASQGQSVRFDIAVQRKKGDRIIIDFSLNPLRDETGEITHLIPFGIDITDRKQAEINLLQSKEKLAQLAAIVESSQDAIMSKTLDGEITSWNKAAEKLFGYKAHEIIGKNVIELIPLERQFEEDLISNSIHKGSRVETYETQRKHQDGFLLDVALTVSPIKDKNGTVIGASKIVRDISGRKRVEFERTQAENELRQSKEQLEDFFDNVSDLIQSVSLRDGRFLFVNRSWRKVFGYSPEEISSLNVFDLIAPECISTCQNSYQQLQNGEVSDIDKAELILLAKDGRKVFLEGSINVRQEDGIPVATRAIFRDVTNQRQAEYILNEQTATLQSFYNSASMMMGIVELSENDIFHVSDNLAALKFFHAKTEGITDKWSSELGVPSENIKLWIEHYHISQELNIPVQFEYAHTIDSKIYWLLATVSFIGIANSNRPRFSYVVQDISDRKLAEEALRLSEARFQHLASHVPSIIYTIVHPIDAPAYFEYISSAVEDIFEVTPEQVYADSSLLFQKWHPDDIDDYKQMVQHCIVTLEPFAFDWRIITPSGKLKWLDVHASVERRNNGDTFGHGIVRDISDRKQTELALHRSEEKYRLLIDNLHAGFAVYAPDTSIILCNSNACKLLGLTLDQMLGKTEIDPEWHLFREDLSIMPLEEYPVNQVLSNGLPLRNYVLGINHCDHSQVWVLVNAFPEFDTNQLIQQVAITFIDISDRKQAEAELQKLSERLDLSLKSGAIGSWDWDLSNKENGLLWDKRMYEIYGLEHLERTVTYQDWADLIHPDDFLSLETALQESIQEKKDFDIEFRILKANGEPRWIKSLASMQLNAQGEPIRITGINYDVTDRKQIELDLKYTNQHLNDLIIDLNQRHVEMLTLSEISDFLQACLTVEEACNALSHLVEPLFPQCAGGIFITSALRNTVEMMSSWGEALYSEKVFLPKDCWALRRGRIHFHTRNGLCCDHIPLNEDIAATICIPMIAQGETIGLFYLSTNTTSALSEAKQQVARTLAEQVGMAIANLRLRESLQQQSIRDPLTGLYNRRYLEESLEQELSRAQRQKHPISMIMIDIDHFKRFNDNYGHDAGDYVLQTVGTLLKKYVRGSDVACRYGGEEMILVLPELSLEAASKRAEEIREAISQIVLSHNGKSLGKVTASFGAASFPQHGIIGGAVMQSADAALYRAKAAGRNQVMTAP